MKKILYPIFFCCFLFLEIVSYNDLVIVGFLAKSEGIGNMPIILINELAKDLKINFIDTRSLGYCFSDFSETMQHNLFNNNKEMSRVALYTDYLWFQNKTFIESIPQESHIKIALSMLESSLIPQEWVEILNKNFDCVCVPDDFLIDVYKNSGVNIPIFVIPCPIKIDSFLNYTKKKSRDKFVFGSISALVPRKNNLLLIEAFSQEFGNNPDVQLIVHSKSGDLEEKLKAREKIKKLKLDNIFLLERELSHKDYLDLLVSFDCYVLLSKGEGFSITPRQALSLEIPCILLNHTAHKVICDSGFVCSIDAPIQVLADYRDAFGENVFCGNNFNCTVSEARKAIRDVYNNYAKYKDLAMEGKKWVTKYDFSSVKKLYLSLIKPKKIIFGRENKIKEDCIITNSKELYEKYNILKKLEIL